MNVHISTVQTQKILIDYAYKKGEHTILLMQFIQYKTISAIIIVLTLTTAKSQILSDDTIFLSRHSLIAHIQTDGKCGMSCICIATSHHIRYSLINAEEY